MESIGPLCHIAQAYRMRLFFPRHVGGRVMTRWYPDWQMTIAWLVVAAVAGVIYFGPMTRVLGFGN